MDERISFISELYKSRLDSTKMASSVEGFSKFVFQSIMGTGVNSLVELIQTMKVHLGSLISQTGVFGSVETQKAYYLGMIVALAGISEQAVEQQKDDFEFDIIFNQYDCLCPMLQLVNQKGVVSHNDLCRCLKKSPSAMTNYYLRIEQYSFFTDQKSGRNKLYFLTPRGRKAYSVALQKKYILATLDYEEQIYVAISEISRSILEGSQDANKVYLNILNRNPEFLLKKPDAVLGEIKRLLIISNRNRIASVDFRTYDNCDKMYFSGTEEVSAPSFYREANIREVCFDKQVALLNSHCSKDKYRYSEADLK
jgi:hypothetical protein